MGLGLKTYIKVLIIQLCNLYKTYVSNVRTHEMYVMVIRSFPIYIYVQQITLSVGHICIQ